MLTGVSLSGAMVTGATFHGTTSLGFAQAQLQSTASCQANDLRGIGLWHNDLSGWDFSGQNLTNAFLSDSTLTDANLSGANLKNASLRGAVHLSTASFDTAAVYNQWTVFPDGFDPTVAGLTLQVSALGDLNANDVLDADDVDWLAQVNRGTQWKVVAIGGYLRHEPRRPFQYGRPPRVGKESQADVVRRRQLRWCIQQRRLGSCPRCQPIRNAC